MGRNTPEADAAGMGYTDDSCCGDKHSPGVLPAQASGWAIKERRGGPLGETGMRAVVSTKRRKKGRGNGGSGARDKA